MPNFDRTGPRGYGSLTGKGNGSCGGGMRRGFCKGTYGRGFDYKMRGTLTKDEEKKILNSEIEELDLMKQGIEKRIQELE